MKTIAGAVVVVALLVAALAWSRSTMGTAPPSEAGVRLIDVGYLPVTCHLTCPVTDFTTRTSAANRFVSQRFTDFPTMVEAMKSGRLEAAFLIAPLAMKLREQGVAVRIVYLGHRDGSTIMVATDSPARSLADLRGRTIAFPSRFSNQYLVMRKLMRDAGIGPDDFALVELPPPEMPAALASRAIDAYFVGEPHAARAELDGTGRVLHHAKDIWPGFVSCVLVVTERLIAAGDEAIATGRIAVGDEPVRDLVRGIARSGAWAETHRLEAARLVAPYFRQDEKLLHHVLTQPPDRVSYRMLTPSMEEFTAIRDMAIEAGILGAPIPIPELLDLRFIPDEIAELDLTAAAGARP
ncbi:MAG TPA: ABC transporter substrate-binding protein [Planctomycetota bacterium]|nr:ABC transporter substrate-binding protein [Planctomycetota bacterium]